MCSATVSEPVQMSATCSSTDVNCFGALDGTASVIASGGTAPYSYQWSNGATTSSITGMATGIYTATVTDANGCTSECSATVNQPASAVIAAVSSTDATCGLANGTASVSVTGGTAPYTYLWSNGSTDASISGLAAGSYTVTVTDAHGCTTENTVVVNSGPSSVSCSVSSTPALCGKCNGTATVTAINGTAPYTYVWSNGSTDATATGLCAGTYTVVVTDANGCSSSSCSVVVGSQNQQLSCSITKTNVSCYGGNDGSATVNVNGNGAPYTYVWSNGATTQTITNLTFGFYTVTVTSSGGCTTKCIICIFEPTSLSCNTSSTDATCGSCDGTASVTATGGKPGYTYLWSNGQVGANATNLCAGLYTVTVTDKNGCTTECNAVVSGSSQNLSCTISKTHVSCFGGNNGSAAVSVTGGNAPYTYLWSNGSTTATVNGLAAGIYTVTVTSGAGCTTSCSVKINQPSTSVACSVVSTDATCGACDGTATAIGSGGIAPYTYVWSNGQTTMTATGLCAGNYDVTVTDSKGCSSNCTVKVDDISQALTCSVTKTNVSCQGGNDGSATVVVIGGTAPYTYAWSNGATTATIGGLSAGTYTVTVWSAAGCSTECSIKIGQPKSVVTCNATATNATCGGCNGTATATATGGKAPYTYLWSNGQTTMTATGLCAGNYDVTVTDSKGCSSNCTVKVDDISQALTCSVTKTNVSCQGGNDGSATVVVIGGTAPYTYAWSNGATTATIGGLSAGTYTVSVWSAAGCSTECSIKIGQPKSVVTCNATVTNATCGGCNGTATATATGGKAPYTYLWSNGQTTMTATGLCAGNYDVTVTDSKGCSSNCTVKVDDISQALTCSVTKTNVSCQGGNDGSATVVVIGGTAPYTYAWSNGATTATIGGLSAGTYTVTVWSAAGCSTECSIKIGQPKSVVTCNATATNATCGGCNGTATATATGGKAPYTYLWSNGQTTMTATGLCAGNYDVTVTDSKGCSSNCTVKVDDISQALTCSVTKTNVSCQGGNDGSATVVVIGGTAPYTYAWSNGATTATIGGLSAGTYTVTVWSAAGCSTECSIKIGQPKSVVSCNATATNATCGGCNGTATATATGGKAPYTYLWSNGQTTMTATGLCAGNYDVTVTDSKGCSSNCIVKVDDAGSTMSASATSTNALCGACNGTATVSVSGGTMPYSYAWNNGQTGATATGLCGGNYSVVVTDANGCTAAATVKVDDKNATIVMFYRKHHPTCNGGNDGGATIKPSGGTAPYTYLWSNGSTTKHQPTLSAGIYTVTVTDANGCSASTTIKIGQPAALVAVGKGKDATCKGCDGKAKVLVDGGREPYTYLWSNGATTDVVANVCAGTYVVTVTDAGGCQTMATVVINGGQASISASISKTHSISCRGGNDGELTATATGGSAPYTYAWSNGQSGAIATNLTAGIYTVTATDANGCTGTASFSLTQPQKLVAIIGNSTNAACGICNGTASVSASGGTAPYSYLWSNGSTSDQISSLCAGTYTVTVTDGKGCDVNTMVSITDVQDEVKAIIQVVAPVSCHGAEDGSLKAKPTSGTGPFTFLWSNGATTQVIGNLKAGKYTVTVTSAYGCTAQVMYTLVNPKDPCDKIKTAMEGEALLSKFNVYPNPTLGRFVVSFNAKQSAYYSIDIKDINGKVVENFGKVSDEGLNEVNFDLSAYPPAVYTVRFTMNDNVQVVRVVKQY
ncbi:MAG: T9SS type A sorting domain-containing protein [Bacteroidetes bacterium]|nr:T9SS type A sorting domain-containing protein [Bacteroidota bacterium]